MTPHTTVSVIAAGHERAGQAGVVESVEKNEAGEVVAVTVDMDLDHARIAFDPQDLRTLKAH